MKQIRKSEKSYSKEHLLYLKNQKARSFKIKCFQIGILIFLMALWEIAAHFSWIDSFITGCPSGVWNALVNLNSSGNLWGNVWFTVLETVAGFIFGTIFGVLIAVAIWNSEFFSEIVDPYLVVLNALPKVALGPIIIVWLGAGISAVMVMALLVSVIISAINILTGFKSVNPEKILLMKSFGASKLQILSKLVFPANVSTIISTLKINVGMSLIGVITGEFLVASKGVGYLIVYGGQVFKLDLVMAGIFILAVIASCMYGAVAKIEKIYLKKR